VFVDDQCDLDTLTALLDSDNEEQHEGAHNLIHLIMLYSDDLHQIIV
jgi:hypothetical protein